MNKFVSSDLYSGSTEGLKPQARSLLYLCGFVKSELEAHELSSAKFKFPSVLDGLSNLQDGVIADRISEVQNLYIEEFATNENRFKDASPRIILEIDLENRFIFCCRSAVVDKRTHCTSLRWQPRDENELFTVFCGNEHSYTAKLFLEEGKNLKTYLTTFGPMWNDYTCIQQTSSADIAEQINLMGQIYSCGTTLFVGSMLSPTPPPEEYLSRAWCFQERQFGYVKYIWNTDDIPINTLLLYTKSVMNQLEALRNLQFQLKNPLGRGEEWRLNEVESLYKKFPQEKQEFRSIIARLQQANKTDADTRKLCNDILAVRNKIYITNESAFVPSEWPIYFFECQVFLAKDRLPAIWGVPCFNHGLQLDFTNPLETWRTIEATFPNAGYAFHMILTTEGLNDGYPGFASVEDIVLNVMGVQELTLEASRPIHGECIYNLATRPSLTYKAIWDDKYIAVACDKDGSHSTVRFVATIDCLRLDEGVGGERKEVWKYIKLMYSVLRRILGVESYDYRDWLKVQHDLTGLGVRLAKQLKNGKK